MKIDHGVVKINQHDLKTSHEEADVIMIQQMSENANEDVKSINILCDDTDVFALLVYHYSEVHLRCSVTIIGGHQCWMITCGYWSNR